MTDKQLDELKDAIRDAGIIAGVLANLQPSAISPGVQQTVDRVKAVLDEG